MLTSINPKLPMRDKVATMQFYVQKLGFQIFGSADYDDYLMVEKDNIQIHFFSFKDLNPKENYGQAYIRTDNIQEFYTFVKNNNTKCTILEQKPWQMMEFSILDPDMNLLTFGQGW